MIEFKIYLIAYINRFHIPTGDWMKVTRLFLIGFPAGSLINDVNETYSDLTYIPVRLPAGLIFELAFLYLLLRTE